MSRSDLEPFRSWFEEFIQELFGSGGDENVALKREHSLRVLHEAERIAAPQGLSPGLEHLIRVAALLHDIGRFPQYRDYGTFDDRRSINHGLLGFRTLRGQSVLSNLNPPDRRLVLQAVYWHNRLHIPDGLPGRLDLAVRLLRDADKLDIYSVLISHLTSPGAKDQTVTLGLEDDPERFNPEIVDRIQAGKRVLYQQMRSINDFALLLLSWVHDLNFAATRQAVRDRGHIQSLCTLLPDEPPIRRLQDQLMHQVS